MGIQDRDYYWNKKGRPEPRFKKVEGQWVRVERKQDARRSYLPHKPKEFKSRGEGEVCWGGRSHNKKIDKASLIIFFLLGAIVAMALVKYGPL